MPGSTPVLEGPAWRCQHHPSPKLSKTEICDNQDHDNKEIKEILVGQRGPSWEDASQRLMLDVAPSSIGRGQVVSQFMVDRVSVDRVSSSTFDAPVPDKIHPVPFTLFYHACPR